MLQKWKDCPTCQAIQGKTGQILGEIEPTQREAGPIQCETEPMKSKTEDIEWTRSGFDGQSGQTRQKW